MEKAPHRKHKYKDLKPLPSFREDKKLKNTRKSLLYYALIALVVLIVLVVLAFNLKIQREPAECRRDSDCVKVQTTCCPCTSGGEEVCAPGDKAEQLAAKGCSATQFCAQVFNCQIKSCSCNRGTCQAVPF